MTTAWERELNRLERDLVAAGALLDEDQVPPAERWYPPEGIGPLPEELRPRVEQLLERLATVSRRAAQRRDELGTELTELHKRRDAARHYHGTDPFADPAGSSTTT